MSDFDKTAVNWQKKCIEQIKDEKNVILSSPTGSGKTKVYKEWARLKGKKIYITAPIKALSNQRYRELSEQGFNVGLETGDIKSIPDNCDTICCTQEIYTNKYVNDKEATLVIDEVHYIFDNPERARTYIDALNKSKAENIMLCSATLGDLEELQAYVEKVSGRQFKTYENKERLTELYYENYLSSQHISDALVVTFSRYNCERIALNLASQREYRSPEEEYKIEKLADEKNIYDDSIIELAKKGVAYYYGSLLPKEKLFIEELYEERLIDTVVGTDALALGVNFPVENVVFAQLAKYYDGPISRNLFEQLAGRAGRKGYFDKGYVYYCDDFYVEANEYYTESLFGHLLQKENEGISINLQPSIKAILQGKVTVTEEAEYISKYSTIEQEKESVEENIQRKIDYIKSYDVSRIFKEDDEEIGEEQRARNIQIQKEFEENIADAYFDEYSIEKNCWNFSMILAGASTDDLMYYNEGSFSNLLQFRKYVRALPKQYRKNLNLSQIDDTINEIDETALNLERGKVKVEEIKRETVKEQMDRRQIDAAIARLEEQMKAEIDYEKEAAYWEKFFD